MTNIRRHTGSNIGGINPVRLIETANVGSLTVDEVSLEATITVNQTIGWTKVYATDGTIVIDSSEEPTSAGTLYKYAIKMRIPKDRQDISASLLALNNKSLIIIAHDKNGTARIYGTLENPMRKIGKDLKPADVAGYNGYEVTFSGSFSSPAPYVDTAYLWDEDDEEQGSGVD